MTVARHLPQGVTPEVVLWDAPSGPDTWQGIPVRRLERGRGGARGFAAQAVALARMSRADPKPLMAFLTYSNLLALAATRLAGRTAAPVLISEHNHTSRAMAEVDRRARAKVRVMRRLYPASTAIVAVTDDVAADLSALLGIDRTGITTIHNPVDVASIRHAAAAPAPHGWLTDDAGPVVTCVGALRRAKGHPRLLHALAARTELRALIVGDGPAEEDLRRLADDLGVADRVDFVGFQHDPAPWMGHAAAVVIPSRWEGFALVAVEAAAAGTRVIGSDIPGLGEVLRIVGGRLVTEGHDDPSYAKALVATLDDALRRPVPTYRLDSFDPDATAARYAACLGLGERS